MKCCLKFIKMDWPSLNNNMAFFNQVKQLVQIRKTYKDILAPFAGPLNGVNLAKVASNAGLQAYGMFNGNTAIVVAGTKDNGPSSLTLQISPSDLGLGSYKAFRVTNLMNGTAQTLTAAQIKAFTVPSGPYQLHVYKITGQ